MALVALVVFMLRAFFGAVAPRVREFGCFFTTNEMSGKCEKYILHSCDALKPIVDRFDVRVGYIFQLSAKMLNVVVGG